MEKVKSYPKLILQFSYTERLEYLKLGDNNVSSPRDISNKFYKSDIWLKVRNDIIIRDCGCDLGVNGMYITGPIIVHHIDPITRFDIINNTFKLIDPDNLICTSIETHNKIHYATYNEPIIERSPNDTILW